MIKVYCENGALRKELKQLKKDRRIELIHFPYEGNARSLDVTKVPSRLTIDITHVTIDSTMRISDCGETDMYSRIIDIIGNHEFDARHIDTAYKNNCDVLLSRDKDDVIGHTSALRELLKIEFLHPDDDWDKFLTIVNEDA